MNHGPQASCCTSALNDDVVDWYLLTLEIVTPVLSMDNCQ